MAKKDTVSPISAKINHISITFSYYLDVSLLGNLKKIPSIISNLYIVSKVVSIDF